MMIERRNGRFIAACVVLWIVQLSAAAQAQTLRIALFKTASSPELAPLTAALDPTIQAEVGKVPKVSVAAVPPLDLPSLQLALDCVGETAECLSVATERSKVEGLLSPSLVRTGGSIVLSLLLYNQQASSPLQVVTRSYPNDVSEAGVIDGAKMLVRELFGVAAPAAEPAPAPVEEPPPAATTAPPEATLEPARPLAAAPDQKPSLVVPIVLGAAGVAVIALGVGFGVASNSTESRYADARVDDDADARTADDLLSSARTQSTIANVAFGVGAASCVAAGVVYFLQRKHRQDTAPNAHVALGPGYIGVAGGF
jgi:hypothetical protein